MANVFKYKVVNYYNRRPAITAGFVDEVLTFFGGGHTPEIRTALIALRKVSEDGETMLNRNVAPIVVEHTIESEVQEFDQDFARFMVQTFEGGHTPAIRGQLLHLERIAEYAHSSQKDTTL